MDSRTPNLEAARAHYQRAWGDVIDEFLPSPDHARLLPDTRILSFARESGAVTMATIGMSAPQEEELLELHTIVDPRRVNLHALVDLMFATAHYHQTAARLSLHHCVNFGIPAHPKSRLTRGYLSLPYFDGPSVEFAEGPDPYARLRCLWLVPISEGERELLLANGVEVLESTWERQRSNLLDMRRKPVA